MGFRLAVFLSVFLYASFANERINILRFAQGLPTRGISTYCWQLKKPDHSELLLCRGKQAAYESDLALLKRDDMLYKTTVLRTLWNDQSKPYHLMESKPKTRKGKSEYPAPKLVVGFHFPNLSLGFVPPHQIVKRVDSNIGGWAPLGSLWTHLGQTLITASLLLLNDLPWGGECACEVKRNHSLWLLA